jgi:hypothetical protein
MLSCDDNASNSTDSFSSIPLDDREEPPAIFSKYKDNVKTIFAYNGYVYIESNGIPNHKSPYFGSGNSNYEAFNLDGVSFNLNPNRIDEQTLVFKIPISPTKASSASATQLGPIGVSLNGVPFYNQYAGPNNTPLTNEIISFDQYKGHPQNTGQYHYHIEPTYLTSSDGKDAFLGFLLDGFPVYGPEEDGKTITNSDLDAFHGHTTVTADYPNGIYHYHITDADPYLNGSGYYGVVGSVSQ